MSHVVKHEAQRNLHPSDVVHLFRHNIGNSESDVARDKKTHILQKTSLCYNVLQMQSRLLLSSFFWRFLRGSISQTFLCKPWTTSAECLVKSAHNEKIPVTFKCKYLNVPHLTKSTDRPYSLLLAWLKIRFEMHYAWHYLIKQAKIFHLILTLAKIASQCLKPRFNLISGIQSDLQRKLSFHPCTWVKQKQWPRGGSGLCYCEIFVTQQTKEAQCPLNPNPFLYSPFIFFLTLLSVSPPLPCSFLFFCPLFLCFLFCLFLSLVHTKFKATPMSLIWIHV